MTINVAQIRHDFPILQQKVNDEPLTYFDNAATSQTPLPVLDALRDFYLHDRANVHRGVHTLAQRATDQYEKSRAKVAHFINAASADEIVFDRSTTEGLNLVARAFGDQVVQAGDEIVLSIMEHHSNLVPWQELAQRKGASLRYIELNDQQELDLACARDVIGPQTKIVAISAASNVLGVLNPVKEIAKLAHQYGAYVVVDGAQLIGHYPVDVQDMGADFFAFSGHKMLAPTGIGAVYGRQELWQLARPVQFGGEMIADVQREQTTFKPAPLGFEAGTPNIGGAIALGAAIDYLESLGMDQVAQREKELANYLLPRLKSVPHLQLYGPQDHHTGVFSFNLGHLHPHDLATGLDMEGVAVRAGHHCAQPLMAALHTTATARASLAFYNTKDECDRFIDALNEVGSFFDELE